jgi:hypothetical protein
MSNFDLGWNGEAVEVSWEEYDRHMVESGQWMTEDSFMECCWAAEQEERRRQYEYDFLEGC